MALTTPTMWRLGDDFDKIMPHHAGIEALWKFKWKFPCMKGVYPFHDGLYTDFEPIFESLIKRNINNPEDERYTGSFIIVAKLLAATAACCITSDLAQHTTLLLRACALLRIARFPYISTHVGLNACQAHAWALQKEYYILAASRWRAPVMEINIPFINKTEKEADEILVYFRRPWQDIKCPNVKNPVMILMTGLDGYRPDNTARLDAFNARGWSSITVEIPGTADCPADPSDPSSPDRLWSSILTWIASEPSLDPNRVLVWGLSAGGYYSVRIAHTHADRLMGVVAQGAGVHHFFGEEWNEKIEGHEYPFRIFPYLALKHGCATKEAYLSIAQSKFSLLETGILNMKSTKLLLINGTKDGLMPVEDSLLCMEQGLRAKSGYFVEGGRHMGYPEANEVVYAWLDEIMKK